MALSYQQAQLVRGTIPALRQRGETITSLFYDSMLREHPELNNYFNRVNLVNGRQPRALCAVILKYASNINNISELIPKLERMCNKHCSLGIKPEHYELVSKYLIQAFAEVLGPDMTPAVREAWTKAYSLLARMLCTREAQIYAGFGKWNAWRTFRIDRKVLEADDMWSFYLVPQDGKPIPGFLPGQYVSVQFHVPEMGHNQIRQYSLSDAPRPDYYRITVQRDEGASHTNAVSMCYFNPGVVSNILVDDLQVGSHVNLSHPSGDFFLDTTADSSVPLVLLSEGVGVAPMVAMVNQALETQPLRRISWVQGSKRQGLAPFHKHMKTLQGRCQNLSLNVQCVDTGSRDHELQGGCDQSLAHVEEKDLVLDHGGTEYYVCGPEQFMAHVSGFLMSRGIPQGRIHLQVFSTGDAAGNPSKTQQELKCPFRAL